MSARAGLLALGLALGACALSEGHLSRPAGGCPTLVVENWNFADVVLRSEGRRIAVVNGLSTDTLEVCWLRDRPPVFDVHAIGGAIDFRMSGVGSRMSPTTELYLTVGSTAGGSRVIGHGFDIGQDSATYVVGAQRTVPMGLHLGIWYDVIGCLDLGAEQTPDPLYDVAWVVADSLKSSDGRLAYGLASRDPLAIVLEGEWWFSSTVISHEAVHILTGDDSEVSWGMLNCVMPAPFDMPERWWKVPDIE